MAHRLIYTIAVGPIPAGLQIDHLCRNKPCVNPLHLEPVTPRENTLRSPLGSGERARRSHCPRGHAYSEGNTYVSRRNQRVCRACHAAAEARRRALRRAAR